MPCGPERGALPSGPTRPHAFGPFETVPHDARPGPGRPSPLAMRLCLLAALALAAAPAWGQARGETAFDLVRLDPSARAAALAGAGALPGDDPTAGFYNPALLAPPMSRALAIGYTNHVADVSAGSAVYARDLRQLGLTGSLAVRFLSYGEFDRRAGDEAPSGTFSAGETAVTATLAREVLPRLRAGASVHALFASIDEAGASALAGDLGVVYAAPEQALTLGASVHHVGATLSSLGAERDRLPLDVRLTATKGLRYLPLTVSVSGIDLQDMGGADADSSLLVRTLDHLALGGELALGQALSVRLGYNGRRGDALRSGGRLDLAGTSVGAGLALRRVTVDYAFTNWGDFGGYHQFGLRTKL